MKLANITNFFRKFSQDGTEKKSGQVKSFDIFSKNSHRTGSTKSGSPIARFFAKLFGSKEKARKSTDTAFRDSTQQNAATQHVKSPWSSSPNKVPNAYDASLLEPFTQETSVKERLRFIDTNKVAPPYLNSSDDAHSAPPPPNSAGQTTEAPPDHSDMIGARTQFIRSPAGRFQLDVVDMATLIENAQGRSRTALPGSPAETLIHAFQIYFEEEGKIVDPDNLVSPDWRQRKTAHAPEDLKTLSENLQKIPANNPRDRDLIQKAIVTIQRRIDGLSSNPEKNKTPGP